MNLKRFSVVAAFLMILSSGPASATTLATVFSEDFGFSGALTSNGWTQTGTTATNPIGTTTGLTFAGYVGSGAGNAAFLTNTGQDVNHNLTSIVSSGAAYASFMLNVTSPNAADYFMHFGQDNAGAMNTSIFRGKVFTTTDGTGDYELGLQFGVSTLPATAPTRTNLDLAYGTTYLVVLKYEVAAGLANDLVSLFVFSSTPPASEPAPTLGPLVDATQTDLVGGVSAIALRQYNASQRQVVDGIRVTTAWSDAVPVELVQFSID